MDKAISPQLSLETPADYEAAIAECLAEMQHLNEQMQNDRADIERLRGEIDALKAETQQLKTETRTLLVSMGAKF